LCKVHINKDAKIIRYEYSRGTGITFKNGALEIDYDLFNNKFEKIGISSVPEDIAADIKNEQILVSKELKLKKRGKKVKNINSIKITKDDLVHLNVYKLSAFADLPVPVINKELAVQCTYYVVATYNGRTLSDDNTGETYLVKMVGKTVRVAPPSKVNSIASSPEFTIWRANNAVVKQVEIASHITKLFKDAPVMNTNLASIYSNMYINEKKASPSSISNAVRRIQSDEYQQFVEANKNFLLLTAKAHGFARTGDTIDTPRVRKFINDVLLMKSYIEEFPGIVNHALPRLSNDNIG